MSIIKNRQNDTWKSAYANYIGALAENSKNLSDMTNKAEVRKNLELAGNDVINHNHDSRYLGPNSLLKKEEADRIAGDQALDTDIANYLNYLETMLSPEEKGSITRKLNEIESKLAAEENNYKVADTNIRSYAEKKLASLNKEINSTQNKKVIVPNSTIRTNYNTFSSTVVTNNSDKSITTSSHTEYIAPGINGGIYTLANLLDKLANLSHKHTVTDTSVTTNCRCDCNDTRCCGGGPGGR